MAPEIALRAVAELPARSLVLDPMAGSGTVLRAATDSGHSAIGFDLDPLAILMAKVWNTPINIDLFVKRGYEILDKIESSDKRLKVELPWIDADGSTQGFINEWFFPEQRRDLRRLSYALRHSRGPIADALRVCFSRLIIKKEGGASRGDDVSHSRPHRRHEKSNDFDVMAGFETSLIHVANLIEQQPPRGGAELRLGDGRQLSGLRTRSISSIVTSPPYLNAIDYMRGHKLTLVWLGYQIGTLSAIRSASVGAERAADQSQNALVKQIIKRLRHIDRLPRAQQRMIDRYILDLHAATSAAHRVLKDDGQAVFVVGNSCLRGVFIRNSDILEEVATAVGFRLRSATERELPAIRRYMPPPTVKKHTQIENRMRTEVVLRFDKRAATRYF
jgi:tRNA G10  N-methylase Trm11